MVESMTTAQIHYRGSVDYDKLDGVNFSTLKELRRSPKHYQHRRQNPRPPTPSLALGHAAHVAILEPECFLREFALWDATDEDGKTRQRRGKLWDAFKAQNANKTIIRTDEYDRAIRLSRAVRDSREAMRYLVHGRHEVAVTWVDQHTGLRCKGRCDWLTEIDGEAVIVDPKSTRDASPWSFGRDAAKYGYHLQKAFYADGFEQALGRPVRSVIIAIETEEPYDVVVYRVPPDVLDIGRDEYRKLLETLSVCAQSNSWPGYGGGLEQELTLPAWAVPDEGNDLTDLGLVM